VKICIVGGAGKMGRVFARVLSKHGEVHILDVSDEREKVAKELSVKLCSLEEIPEMDVVIISVPIEKTSEVIREVAPLVRDGALLSDLTSLKEFPVREMLEFSSEGVSVIGMHPLFGPFTPMNSQTVILTPARHRKEHLEFLEGVIESEGARTVIMSPEDHDRLMAVVQCLSHFTLVSFGLTLRKLGFKPSSQLIPPAYLSLFDLAGRILHQDPKMYGEIQKNPHAQEVRKAFLESASELDDSVENSKFAELMKLASEHFGDTRGAFLRSEKLLRCRSEEMKFLLKSLNSEISLRNVESSEITRGTLLEVDGEERTLRVKVGEEILELSLDEYEILRTD